MSIRPMDLTLLLPLAERNHLVELSLDESIALVLVQPHPARKCLLHPGEWAVDDHLDEKRPFGERGEQCMARGSQMARSV